MWPNWAIMCTPVGIVPKIILFVIRVCIVCQPMCDPQLDISFKKIEIIMAVQPVVIAKGRIVGVVIDKSITRKCRTVFYPLFQRQF